MFITAAIASFLVRSVFTVSDSVLATSAVMVELGWVGCWRFKVWNKGFVLAHVNVVCVVWRILVDWLLVIVSNGPIYVSLCKISCFLPYSSHDKIVRLIILVTRLTIVRYIHSVVIIWLNRRVGKVRISATNEKSLACRWLVPYAAEFG